MMTRDEAWERTAAAHAITELRGLLQKGQDLDAELDGSMRGTLRSYLVVLKDEIERALN